MPRINADGSILPSHLPAASPDYRGRGHYNLFGIYRGDIRSVVYADDPNNRTGDVEYIVTIMGQNYEGVTDIRHAGAIHNSHVRVRRGVEHIRDQGLSKTNPNSDGIFSHKRDGEAVWCMFVEGDGDFPVIVGSRSHLRRRENPDFKKPTKILGVHERYEFNGVEFLIDKDGNLELSQIGVKDARKAGDLSMESPAPKTAPVIKNPEAITPSPTKITLSKNGDFSVRVSDEQLEMQFTKATKKIELKAGLGSKITIDGSADIITAETNLGSKLKLGNGKVGLGGPSGEVVELLAEATDRLIDVVTKLSVTQGNLGYPISTAADFLTLIQDIVPIKTKLAQIGGGI